MKRWNRYVPVALVALAALAAPAFADVTIKSTMTGKGLGMGGTTNTVTYIKGNKMRSDVVMGDTTRTTIFDIDTQKMISFDSKSKEAGVYDMSRAGAEIAKAVQMNDMKASLKPNGQTKMIAGKSATGYVMEITVPAMVGGGNGMKMVVNLTGPVWVVQGAPGSAEYLAFYKNAVEKGFFFSDPRSARAQPGPAKAMRKRFQGFCSRKPRPLSSGGSGSLGSSPAILT